MNIEYFEKNGVEYLFCRGKMYVKVKRTRAMTGCKQCDLNGCGHCIQIKGCFDNIYKLPTGTVETEIKF